MMPSRVRCHQNARSGDLAVECWCRKHVLYVPLALIRAGKTESCGGPYCTEQIWSAVAARKAAG